MPEATPLNIGLIVDSNLCIGCGLCTATCQQNAITMIWQRGRTWQPVVNVVDCNFCSRCYQVCPHSPQCILEYAAVAKREGPRFGLSGRSFFIAFDRDETRRIRSASGGALTALLQGLLSSGAVDGVVASLPIAAPVGFPHFELKVFRNAEELDQGRSSHYHPLSYDKVLAELKDGQDGGVAVVGVPCVLRGMKRLPAEIQRKIKFRVCLVCSHNVSGAFTDCLAAKEGVNGGAPFLVNMRDKLGIPDANNYNNRFFSAGQEFRRNRFATAFTEMWRNYFFARECCLYCPDFFGLDADVAVKDAWGRLSSDPLGTSLVIVKNAEIESQLLSLKESGRLFLERCDESEVFNSQIATAVFKHQQVRDRLVWKKAIRDELGRSFSAFEWKRRWLSPVSREYWRLWLLMKLSNYCHVTWRKVPVKSLLFLLSPLKVNRMLVLKVGKRLKQKVFWPWRAILRPTLKAAVLFAGYRRPRGVVGESQLRVLIAGGYGYGNVGDEAQLAANLQYWNTTAPACRLTVLTPNPAYTQQVHDQIRVELAPRKAIFGLRGREYFGSEKKFKRFFFPVAAWCLLNACLVRAGLPTLGLTTAQARLLDELKNTDVLFLSGGGYLTGMTLTRLWDHMLLIRLAYALGVPTILSGQTIGVFKDPVSRVLARWGLKKSKLIYLRDPVDSPEALADLGIPADRYKSTFDDALFWEASSPEKVQNMLLEAGGEPNKPYLAVNVHYWGQSPKSSRVIMKNLAKVLDRVVEDFDLQVVFVPMARSDETAIGEVLTAMERPGIMPKHDYYPDQAVALLQKADLCMTMKHHPIIFAMAAAVPTVSMTFDDYYFHKNYGAMKIFNQENYVIKVAPEELEMKLYATAKEVFLHRADLSKNISTVVEEIRPMSGEVIKKFITDRANR